MIDPTPLYPPKPSTTGDLSPANANNEILARGVDVSWARSIPCPCSRNVTVPQIGESWQSTDTQSSCTECKGSGRLHATVGTIRVLFLSASAQPQFFQVPGQTITGSASVTYLACNNLMAFDRLTVIGSAKGDAHEQTVSERAEFKTHATTIEALDFPIVRQRYRMGQAYPNAATLREVTVGVNYCRVASLTGTLLAGERIEGVDFDVTAGGLMDWTKGVALGTAPVVGAKYVIRYNLRPVYEVRENPHPVRELNTQAKDVSQERLGIMPRQALCWPVWHGPDAG